MPNAPLRLGDIGVLDGPLFDRRASLGGLGVDFEQRRGRAMDLSFASDGLVQVSAGSSGEAANATIEFGSAGAFVFRATGCVEMQIDDLDAVASALVALRDLEERWNPEWSLVDTVVHASGATIAVAETSRATLVLSLDAAPEALSSLIPNGSSSVLRQSGRVFHLIGARSITPLYRTRRFKRSFVDWLRGRKALELGRAHSSVELHADAVFEAEGIG